MAKKNFNMMIDIVFEQCNFIRITSPMLLDSDNLLEGQDKNQDKITIVRTLFHTIDSIIEDNSEITSGVRKILL